MNTGMGLGFPVRLGKIPEFRFSVLPPDSYRLNLSRLNFPNRILTSGFLTSGLRVAQYLSRRSLLRRFERVQNLASGIARSVQCPPGPRAIYGLGCCHNPGC